MGENQYGPDAYKRLDLVRKQFKTNTAEQKKQESTERRQQLLSSIQQNKVKIARLATYVVLAMIVLAVIGVIVSAAVVK